MNNYIIDYENDNKYKLTKHYLYQNTIIFKKVKLFLFTEGNPLRTFLL